MEMRAEWERAKEIAEVVRVSASYVSQLSTKCFFGGIEATAGIHYSGD